MSSTTDRRLRKLEAAGNGEGIGYVVCSRYEGQPFAEAWREQHGDIPIPEGRAFMLMPDVCSTSEEWLEKHRPR